MTAQKRFMLTLPDDIADTLKDLKKNFYFDKPHSALYRDLIRLGVQKMEEDLKSQNA